MLHVPFTLKDPFPHKAGYYLPLLHPLLLLIWGVFRWEGEQLAWVGGRTSVGISKKMQGSGSLFMGGSLLVTLNVGYYEFWVFSLDLSCDSRSVGKFHSAYF